MKRKLLVTTLIVAFAKITFAQFAAGNLVVLRVGNGTATLSGNTAQVSLLEYSPAGALISTIAVQNATAGNRLTLSGNSNQEGVLSLSPDGAFLTFAGYDAGIGASDHNTTGSQTRTVALVKADKSIDLTTRFPRADMATTVRSSTTADGSGFWVSGAAGGVRYVPYANAVTTNSTQLNSTVVNIRVVSNVNGQLTIGANTAGTAGVASVGTGLPITTGQAITNLTSVAAMTPVAFAFFDLSTTVAGNDVLYVADNSANTIRKFSLVSGAWTENGTAIAATDGINGLTGSVVAGKVVLYATIGFTQGVNVGNNAIQRLTDDNGYNAAISGTLANLATPVTAGANYVFRGLSFTPSSTVITTLPVSLTDFNGKNTTQGVQLNWETASELNNQRFDVLRSSDKDNFQLITSLNGKGTTNSVSRYSYLDNQPASGTNYYKLNQVDLDGKITPSKVIAVKTGLTENELSVNVSENDLNLTITAINSANANLQIYDTNGRKVVSKVLILETGLNTAKISINDFPAGVYVTQLTIGSQVLTKKFIK